jgi:hypothetical protein
VTHSSDPRDVINESKKDFRAIDRDEMSSWRMRDCVSNCDRSKWSTFHFSQKLTGESNIRKGGTRQQEKVPALRKRADDRHF